MENLVFSLNATIPIFLTMLLGALFKKIGLFDEQLASKLNKFVFQIGLPVLLFQDLSKVDFVNAWDGRFVLFCFCITVACIALVFGCSFLIKRKDEQGEFIQGSYRSSAALIGVAFIQNIYGTSGMAPLMIIGTVPLYNIMAVVVLSFMQPDRKPLSKEQILHTLKGIITNPIMIGIAAGLLWSLSGITMPVILDKTLKNVSALATPLGLMAMGASFHLEEVKDRIWSAIGATFMKLIGLAAVFLPVAIRFGFRKGQLIAILVMLGSSTTVSGYVMCRNMGHKGELTSIVVMLTTLFSAFTMTAWLFLLRSFGYI